MPLLDLPLELLIEITKHLDHQALARFAQTNHCLFNLATPILIDSSKSWIGRYGTTVLHWAAENGHTSLIEQLLERKVIDIEETEGRLRTALSYAAESGQEAAVRMLLAKGANHSPRDNGKCTPVWRWRKYYPPPSLCPYQTPLHHAAAKGHSNIAQLLVENGADINDCGLADSRPLQIATRKGHHDTVGRLLDLGAIEPESDGCTLLCVATRNGHHSVVQVLLERSRDFDINFATHPDKTTALHRAVWSEERHLCIPFLLAHGADTAARDDEGRTPLHCAALMGYTQAVELLLNSGANIEALDMGGATPLHWAAINHYESVVKLLLQEGADATVEDSNGQTAVDWANKGRVKHPKSFGVIPMLVASAERTRGH